MIVLAFQKRVFSKTRPICRFAHCDKSGYCVYMCSFFLSGRKNFFYCVSAPWKIGRVPIDRVVIMYA